ncbi:MAG TPA: ATP-binding protein [Bacteroidia bacterium]|nr:ATP-binding protein [Bacteroidia bacterium]
MPEKYTEYLRVDPQIVSLLSKSAYQQSFPSAIRELVSNSYDADALSVNIDFDKTYSLIEILDDGNGMTFEEFKRYLRIAGKKQEGQLTRKYKRKRIGNFGVGFLSVFPFCDSLQIITTTQNSNDILTATIPAKDFFLRDKDKTKRGALEINVDDIPINVTIRPNPKERIEHYTKIRLINTTWVVENYFTKPKTKKKDSILFWEPMDRFIWELQEDLPISLNEKSKYYSKYKYDEPIGINVKVNGRELFRNDYKDIIISEGVETINGITCKYLFTSDYKSIGLIQARGVKLRVNNVGIGARTDFDLRRDRGFSRLNWLSGEIFFSEEAKELLNIGRDNFISNSVTDEIFDFFAEKLRSAAMEVEAVALSEKAFSNKVSSQANKSRKEVVEADLRRLENRGYQIVHSNDDEETTIDKKKKIVYVSPKDLDEDESIEVLGKVYKIKYSKWDLSSSNYLACRKEGKYTFVINQDYPLFKSKSLGEVFKKFHILILIGEGKNNTSEELADYLRKIMLEVFNNI